jgi:hypothetical protein
MGQIWHHLSPSRHVMGRFFDPTGSRATSGARDQKLPSVDLESSSKACTAFSRAFMAGATDCRLSTRLGSASADARA